MRDGGLTVGDFVLFVSYLAFVTDFAAELGRYLAQFKQTTVAFARLRTLLADGAGRRARRARAAAPPRPAAGRRGRPAHRAPSRCGSSRRPGSPIATPNAGTGSSTSTCACRAAR